MVDTLALGASAARRGGSSPLSRTKLPNPSQYNTPSMKKIYIIAAVLVLAAGGLFGSPSIMPKNR